MIIVLEYLQLIIIKLIGWFSLHFVENTLRCICIIRPSTFHHVHHWWKVYFACLVFLFNSYEYVVKNAQRKVNHVKQYNYQITEERSSHTTDWPLRACMYCRPGDSLLGFSERLLNFHNHSDVEAHCRAQRFDRHTLRVPHVSCINNI